MDKAQEKINSILHQYIIRNLYETVTIEESWITKQVLQAIKELGYRKLPEGEPPLLEPEKISDIVLRCYTDNKLSCVEQAVAEGVEAQRDICLKWIRGL